jgi:alpha-D-ribose 1-methylphosphonate 5-triphosphate synthase subunit PhnG
MQTSAPVVEKKKRTTWAIAREESYQPRSGGFGFVRIRSGAGGTGSFGRFGGLSASRRSVRRVSGRGRSRHG